MKRSGACVTPDNYSILTADQGYTDQLEEVNTKMQEAREYLRHFALSIKDIVMTLDATVGESYCVPRTSV